MSKEIWIITPIICPVCCRMEILVHAYLRFTNLQCLCNLLENLLWRHELHVSQCLYIHHVHGPYVHDFTVLRPSYHLPLSSSQRWPSLSQGGRCSLGFGVPCDTCDIYHPIICERMQGEFFWAVSSQSLTISFFILEKLVSNVLYLVSLSGSFI